MQNKIYGSDKEGQYELAAEGMSLFLMVGRITPPKDMPEHSREHVRDTGHTHFWYELFFVRRGAIRLCLEHGVKQVSAGELLMVAPGTLHHAEPIEDGDVEQCVFSFSVEIHQKTAAARAVARLLSFSGVQHFAFCGEELGVLIFMLVDALGAQQGALGCSCLLTLLLRLAQGNATQATAVTAPVSTAAARAHSDNIASRLYRLEQLFGRTYTADISLSEMAGAMHLSSRQLARIIRRQYGCTYYEQVTHLRMKRAQQMLEAGEKTVAQIAACVGYATYGGFIAAFRRYFGITPTAYRREVRKKARD